MYEELYEMLQKAKKGDIGSKEWILRELNPLIISSIRKYYYKTYEFDDLLQEGRVVVLDCIQSYDEGRGTYFLGYVKTMLKYYYLDKHKAKLTLSLNEKISEDEDELIDILVSEDEGVLEMLVRIEENKQLENALQTLTERQREIILKFYYEGLSIDKIAEILGVTYRTIVNTKTVALKKLRKELDYGDK